MQKNILIVWNITEAVEIKNAANSGTKNTSHLERDNILYIDVLDYWTNLIKIFFSIPGKELDTKWVDLVYESSIDGSKKLIDIKTQANIWNTLRLYMREFSEDKILKRNFIIFNKKEKQLFWNIYFVSSKLLDSLRTDTIFSVFLTQLEDFSGMNYNDIQKSKTHKHSYATLQKDYNNRVIQCDNTDIIIKFLTPRKDMCWIIWNTPFVENICIDITI